MIIYTQNLGNYIISAKKIINKTNSEADIEFIKENALDIKNSIHEIVQMYQESSDRRIESFKKILLVLVVFASVMLVIGYLSENKLILVLIKKLEYSMTEAADGNLDVSIDIKSKDEFGTLGKTFLQMISKMNIVVSNINDASIQVAEASTYVSNSSISLKELLNKLALLMN